VKRGLVLAVLAALAWPGSASGSFTFGDRNVRDPTLKVDRGGVALVTYATQAGAVRHVLAWGAVNAVAHPAAASAVQRRFLVDYSGGWRSRHDSRYWKTLRSACLPYSGPRLPFFVAGCTAPDGSYWALQRWRRNLPVRGYAPWTAAQRAVELQLSHWSGPLPVLDATMAWTYGGTLQGVFGRLLYRGQPVYGRRSPSSAVTDPWAREVSIDTFDSSFGSGWKHVTQIDTHTVDGGFCYSFVPQPPPAGYPSSATHGNGLGTRIRLEAIGPGVTPIVQWVGKRLEGPFSPARNGAARRHFDAILGGDHDCGPERPS
jgi:hypothetical protein